MVGGGVAGGIERATVGMEFTQGYRVADSTRYCIFPSFRSVTVIDDGKAPPAPVGKERIIESNKEIGEASKLNVDGIVQTDEETPQDGHERKSKRPKMDTDSNETQPDSTNETLRDSIDDDATPLGDKDEDVTTVDKVLEQKKTSTKNNNVKVLDETMDHGSGKESDAEMDTDVTDVSKNAMIDEVHSSINQQADSKSINDTMTSFQDEEMKPVETDEPSNELQDKTVSPMNVDTMETKKGTPESVGKDDAPMIAGTYQIISKDTDDKTESEPMNIEQESEKEDGYKVNSQKVDRTNVSKMKFEKSGTNIKNNEEDISKVESKGENVENLSKIEHEKYGGVNVESKEKDISNVEKKGGDEEDISKMKSKKGGRENMESKEEDISNVESKGGNEEGKIESKEFEGENIETKKDEISKIESDKGNVVNIESEQEDIAKVERKEGGVEEPSKIKSIEGDAVNTQDKKEDTKGGNVDELSKIESRTCDVVRIENHEKENSKPQSEKNDGVNMESKEENISTMESKGGNEEDISMMESKRGNRASAESNKDDVPTMEKREDDGEYPSIESKGRKEEGISKMDSEENSVVNVNNSDNISTVESKEGGGVNIESSEELLKMGSKKCDVVNVERENEETSTKEAEELILDSRNGTEISTNSYNDLNEENSKLIESNEHEKASEIVDSQSVTNQENTQDIITELKTVKYQMKNEDVKNMWSAEEDLRLIDAIETLGLGNWADIAEEVAGCSSSQNKTPKKCMERFLDDFLGRYGHILPPYTLVEDEGGDIDENKEPRKQTGTESVVGNTIPSRASAGRKRMRSETKRSNNFKLNSRKRYRVVETPSLPGYDEVWGYTFLPSLPDKIVKFGDEVGRDQAIKAEYSFVKESVHCSSKKEADKCRVRWTREHLNKDGGPTVLPPRLEDAKYLQGSEVAGYMPRRGDFDVEWDNDAENILADMEFSHHDSPEDRALKLKVIQIYNSKLDEREKRKNFLIERNLLDYRKKQAEDAMRPADERDLVNRMRLFARFHSAEEHENFINNLLKAKRLRKDIAKLQMYRRMGFTSLVDAERFELDRNRREVHRMACRQKEVEEENERQTAENIASTASEKGGTSYQFSGAGNGSYLKQYKPSDRKSRKSTHRSNDLSSGNDSSEPNIGGHTIQMEGDFLVEKDAGNKGADSASYENSIPLPAESHSCLKGDPSDKFNVKKYSGYELLSPKEVSLCQKLELYPMRYLEAKKALIQESFRQGVLGTESNFEAIVKIDVEKRDNVIEFILKSGWIPKGVNVSLGNK
jgi:hypothetical protein